MTLAPNTPITQENVALLPCPFCGGKAGFTAMSDYMLARCEGCGATANQHAYRTSALAATAWNRRPALAKPAEESGYVLSGNPFGTGLSEPKLVRASPPADKRAEALSELAALDGETMDLPVAPPVEGEVVEGESVALMRPFWVSWWGVPGSFELHRPWWVSGEREDGLQSICAAVLAQDEFTARLSVQWAHDDKDAVIEWRFAEEKPKGWSPFGSRFRQADWMHWPESATPAQPDTGDVAALREALEDAIALLWEHVPGIAPRIEPLEAALSKHNAPGAPEDGGA